MNARDTFLEAIEDAESQASIDGPHDGWLVSDDWESLLIYSGGKVASMQHNYSLILANDTNLKRCFRFDTYRRQIMVQGELPFGVYDDPVDFNEQILTKLLSYLGSRYGIENDKMVGRAVREVAEINCFDSLIERLDGLKWDGLPRIETMLSILLGAEDCDYTREAAKLLMRGAVCRAYALSGVQFDMMLVLVGPQGCRKTSFCRSLALCPEYFEDNLGDLNKSEAARKLRGALVVEMAELAAMKSTKQIEDVKAFMTRINDSYRLLYSEDVVKNPRRCVFIGTTNDPYFLSETLWERRYLPVECGVYDVHFDWTDERLTQHFFDQIWAEAVSWYKEDPEGIVKTLTPTKEFLEESKKQQDHFRIEDPWAGPIADYLDANKDKEICAKELLVKALHEEVTDKALVQKSSKRIHEIMRSRFPDWELRETSKRIGEWKSQARYYIYQPD